MTEYCDHCDPHFYHVYGQCGKCGRQCNPPLVDFPAIDRAKALKGIARDIRNSIDAFLKENEDD